MAVAGGQVQAVQAFELLDALERGVAEGGFAFEGVQDDSFDEIAEAEFVVLGDGLEDLEDALFDADA